MALSICKICGESHDQQSGFLTIHILESHGLSLEDYVVKTKYDGIAPKCQCGYCDERPSFYRGDFKTHAKGHKKFEYLQEMYIRTHGVPKCPTCGSDIGSWHRGEPRKYCNAKCQPSTWNQEKIRKTIQERYGVDNVFQLDSVKDKSEMKIDRTANSKKAIETKKKRYANGAFDPVKFKNTMQEKYGVDHPLQIQKNRKASSERMSNFNKDWFKNITIKKYKNTDLYYQSSYELEFIELCESKGMLDQISNGHSYKYLDNKYGHNLLTDFSIGDVEIEIKSAYVLKQQGGMRVLDAKRRAVEAVGKRYMLILDRDYSEFMELIE